jgi:hypothetical protein
MRTVRCAGAVVKRVGQGIVTTIRSPATQVLLSVAILSGQAGAQPTIASASGLGQFPANDVLLSESDFRSELLEAQSRIQSIYFDYVGEDAYRGDERFPPGTFLRRIVAAKSPCLFSHETAHGCSATPWADDIRRRRCIVQNDRAYDIWVTNRSFAVTQPLATEAPLPGSMPGEPVMLAVGIWPLVNRPAPRPGGQPMMLTDVAHDPEYRLLGQRESVAGDQCHVFVKEGMDWLWLSSNFGYSLIARDVHDPDTGVRVLRYELTGHQQIKPGIWMPSAFRIIRYHHLSRDVEARGEVLSDLRFRITECRVNDVDDAFFNFEPPPGSLYLNPGGRAAPRPPQSLPGGEDHLDDLVAWARR